MVSLGGRRISNHRAWSPFGAWNQKQETESEPANPSYRREARLRMICDVRRLRTRFLKPQHESRLTAAPTEILAASISRRVGSARIEFSTSWRTRFHNRHGSIHQERQFGDGLFPSRWLAMDGATNDRSSASKRSFRAWRSIPHHDCLVVDGRPCCRIYRPTVFPFEALFFHIRRRAGASWPLTSTQRRRTMRCSEQAPRSRHLRQTTSAFPPTGRCRARSACR